MNKTSRKKTIIFCLLAATILFSFLWSKTYNISTTKKQFIFHSSSEEEIFFAYKCDLDKNWSYLPMKKEGNLYSIKIELDSFCWYHFTDKEKRFFDKDPYNKKIKDGHPFFSGTTPQKDKNKTRFVSSEHFDLFTTNDTAEINKLEKIYNRLICNFAFFEEDIHPAYNKKIRYYSGIFEGMYAMSSTAEIVDDINILNSHEIIHVLLHKYPHFPPMAEAIAQCFQERGNKIPLTESNSNLKSAEYVTSGISVYSVMKDWNNNTNYQIVASFMYYHFFVRNDLRQPFLNIIKSLTSDVGFDEFERRYNQEIKDELHTTIQEWEKWLNSIDKSSDIYVNWN